MLAYSRGITVNYGFIFLKTAMLAACPAPLNLFLASTLTTTGFLSAPVKTARAGDYVLMRAENDIVLAMSTCPDSPDGYEKLGGASVEV